MPKCPTCSAQMILRKGPYGEFYGCRNYPDCTTTVNVDDVDEKFDVATSFEDGESYGSCRRCGNLETLSEMGYCSYCQSVWDND